MHKVFVFFFQSNAGCYKIQTICFVVLWWFFILRASCFEYHEFLVDMIDAFLVLSHIVKNTHECIKIPWKQSKYHSRTHSFLFIKRFFNILNNSRIPLLKVKTANVRSLYFKRHSSVLIHLQKDLSILYKFQPSSLDWVNLHGDTNY